MKDRVICFDLEGPLSPQDNASDLLEMTPGGAELFRIISRYDDLLAGEGRIGYEPGDTLALIMPFLRWYGLKQSAITKASKNSTIMPGAKELFEQCMRAGRHVYIVSTAYHPHAYAIGRLLNVPANRIFATRINDRFWNNHLSNDALSVIGDAEAYIREYLCGRDFDTEDFDDEIVRYLDELYWNRLPKVGISVSGSDRLATVIGGRRKVLAVEKIARHHKIYLQDLIFVGDSITDTAALQVVDVAGGLSISFNGNKFAIPYATIAVAGTSLLILDLVFTAWEKGGRVEVKTLVDRLTQEGTGQDGDYVWLPSLNPSTLHSTIKRHAQIRNKVRGDVAHLG